MTVRPPSAPPAVRLRRGCGLAVVALFFALDLYATGFFGGSERTLAVVRSIILPGLPFLEWQPVLGVFTIVLMLGALGSWLRWGVSWLPLAVMLCSVSLAATIMPMHHAESVRCAPRQSCEGAHHEAAVAGPAAEAVLRASHEFTIVLVVFAFFARVRLLVAGMPGRRQLTRLVPDGLAYPAVAVARAAAISALGDTDRVLLRTELRHPALRARAARVDRWARLRFRSRGLAGAHAHLRAALALAEGLSELELRELRAEVSRSMIGAIESEPSWVRPLDAVLMAIALDRLGEQSAVARWRQTFAERFPLRHGRRAAALHSPSQLSIGTSPAWEHAASTALAHRQGWLGIDDWTVLRPRCLGAAATGARDRDTLRLVAAGELWSVLTGDREARSLLARRTLNGDAIAAALRRLAHADESARRASAQS